jgi:hypothetical protein
MVERYSNTGWMPHCYDGSYSDDIGGPSVAGFPTYGPDRGVGRCQHP